MLNWCQNVCFRMLSEEESRDRMEDADENGDGIVTWEEYVADAYGMEGNEDASFIDTENAQVTITIFLANHQNPSFL